MAICLGRSLTGMWVWDLMRITAKLYFIVETKIDKEWKDLSDVEKAKINCGGLHFKAVAEDIGFKWAKSYDDFRDKIGRN